MAMYQSTNLKKNDPLDLLREFAVRKKKDKIILEDGLIIFGEHKFPSKTLTRFHSNKKEPQPLDVLWFCLAQEKKSHAEYVKQCHQFKYSFLSLLDRTELLKFLNGKISSSKSIYALSEAAEAKADLKRAGGSLEEEPSNKKAKVEPKPVDTSSLIEAKATFAKVLDTIPTSGEPKSVLAAQREKYAPFVQSDIVVSNSIFQRERLLINHQNFLLSEKKDFSRLVAKFGELYPQKNAPGTALPRAPAPPGGLGGPPRGRPIIIIPSAITSLITLLNCKDFLENDKWVSPVELKERGVKKEKTVLVRKVLREGEAPTTFKVIDSTVQLSTKDWQNVVVVFALGNSWQFKGWQWNTPADLFSHALGFFLTFSDDTIPESIKSWRVKVISVDRRKRHLDKTATSNFWDVVKHRVLTSRR